MRARLGIFAYRKGATPVGVGASAGGRAKPPALPTTSPAQVGHRRRTDRCRFMIHGPREVPSFRNGEELGAEHRSKSAERCCLETGLARIVLIFWVLAPLGRRLSLRDRWMVLPKDCFCGLLMNIPLATYRRAFAGRLCLNVVAGSHRKAPVRARSKRVKRPRLPPYPRGFDSDGNGGGLRDLIRLGRLKRDDSSRPHRSGGQGSLQESPVCF